MTQDEWYVGKRGYFFNDRNGDNIGRADTEELAEQIVREHNAYPKDQKMIAELVEAADRVCKANDAIMKDYASVEAVNSLVDELIPENRQALSDLAEVVAKAKGSG